ncbi:hypothetical protein L580_3516 [Serratia fonticola AU-P3(3)]|nr:hypothetical protein L580_3516 [Serratia fonticola AU-P3(3)]
MDIRFWEGGLQSHELKAIKKLQQVFSKTSVTGGKQKQYTKSGSMFPWRGYAGFRFVDMSLGYEGEFDLIIVTHCNVLVIELKDWNNGTVSCSKDKWYKNKHAMCRSPVSTTRNKQHLLNTKLKRISHKFTNKGYPPRVEFFVVMTGNADFSGLPDIERAHTLSLDEFLAYADQKIFNSKFRPHPDAQVLNQDFDVFDALFIGNHVAPKPIRVNGYRSETLIFDEHPAKLYKEYLAISELSAKDLALLRIWNFVNFEGVKGGTPEGRFDIVSREREVLSYIKHQDHDLYKHCLRSLTSIIKDDVTSEFNEVFELPPGHTRFNEFIGKFGGNFSAEDRYSLVRLVVAKIADLHKLKVAHRDLADHSLWISPGKEIALSSFISAYHQPAGTVGDYREQISVTHVKTNDALTPFQQDIQSLGILCWHIFTGSRISKLSLAQLDKNLTDCTDWYGETLRKAIEGIHFRYASELFDELKNKEPYDKHIMAFDDSELEPFRRNINLQRAYRDDVFYRETSEKEVYVSGNQVVKAWLNVNPTAADPASGAKVRHFFRQLEKLSSVNPPYLPTIREFGIATKSSCLFLVTDKAEGIHWDKFQPEDEEKAAIADTLIAAVEHLHGLGLCHGDLQPENILLHRSQNEVQLKFIDIPDFCADGKEPKSPKYSPENIDRCTGFERDNYAVMRLCCDMLGVAWEESANASCALSNAVSLELRDYQAGFRDLSRFKIALHPVREDSQNEIIITSKAIFESLTIFPDNGSLYVHVEQSKNNTSDVAVTFYGIGGSVRLYYAFREKAFVVCLSPSPRDNLRKADTEKCQLVLDFPLTVKSGAMMELSALTDKLASNDAFSRTVETALTPERTEVSDGLTAQLKSAFEAIEREKHSNEKVIISTQKLWQAVLDTETEAYPYIEMSGGTIAVEDFENEVILPYSSDFDVLGSYAKTDIIEALRVKNDEEIRLGEVLISQSALQEIRLHKISSAARKLEDGDLVFFRTKADKASYVKRKAALERILSNEGVISGLTHYFNSDCVTQATHYSIEVTDDDFARYDRIDEHGNTISLNEKQRRAFIKLLNNGPLSLLQGPPGTGKTEFIAAFVHFLIEKQNVKNILLVSQSHEAVNTAAERIRKHCIRLNTPLDVVRFSNREGAVSTGLRDVY